MPNTDNPSEVTQAIYDYLNDPTRKANLGINELLYGDVEAVKTDRTVAVESGPVRRSPRPPSLSTENILTVYLMIYIGKLQSIHTTRKQADELAEDIKEELDKNVQLGGLVIHGLVTLIEPGYATRGRTTWRTARVTWEGQSITRQGV